MTVVGDSVAGEKPAAEDQAKVQEKNMFDAVGEPSEVKTDEESLADMEGAKLPGRFSNEADGRVKIGTDSYSKDELVISPEEKAAFIDALVTGSRYTQTVDIFGGKLHVTLRSRTADETHAMYAYIRHVLSKGGQDSMGIVEGDMAYVPLVAQIAELNGTTYPAMKAPLTFEENDGKEIPPGWLEDFKAWKAKPEALTSALVSCIQLFEYKYWTMTKEANNKNFWNSDTSIEG
jgi:hypothetical protein